MEQADLLRVLASLIFIVGLLLALAWLARRCGWTVRTGQSRGTLKVAAMQRLGARAAIAVIEVEDARLVVGVTPQQITLLHALPATGTPLATDAPAPRGFAGKLGQALARPQ